MGYASAMAWVLFVITMVCTIDDHQGVATLGALPGRWVPMTTDRRSGRPGSSGGHAFDLGAIAGIDAPDPAAGAAASVPDAPSGSTRS